MKRLLSTFLAAAMLLTSAAFTAVQAAPAESANLQNVTGAFALTDSTKLVEFDGTHLVVECDKTEDTANSTIALYIDSGYTKRDPMTVSSVPSNGNAYDNNRLPEGHHTVLVKTTGTVNVKGVYAKSEKLGESMSLGFEDTKKLSDGAITVVGNGGNTLDLVEGADGSSQALDVKLASGSAKEITLPMNLTLGKEYVLSAKVMPKVVTESAQNAVMRVILYQGRTDDYSNTGYSTYTMSQASGTQMTVGEWNTVSMTFKPTAKSQGGTTGTVEGYGRMALRFGSNNNNGGCEYAIDDIELRPKDNGKKYVVDMNFDNDDLTNTGNGGGTVSVDAEYSYNDNNGGRNIVGAVYGGNRFIKIDKLLLKPNTTYKVTYDVKAANGFANGKYMRMEVSRGGYHKRSDDKESKNQLENIKSEAYQFVDNEWHTLTYYFDTVNRIRPIDEYGYGNFSFAFAADESFGTTIQGDKARFWFDNFRIEELDTPYGSRFEDGKLPDVGNSSVMTKAYNQTDNCLDITINTETEGGYETIFAAGIEQGVKYVIEYDVKGPEGNKIRSLVTNDGLKGNDGTDLSKWMFLDSNWFTLNGEWQKYRSEFTYTTDGKPHTYPKLCIRANLGGLYQYKNIKCYKKPAAGVYNISAANLTEKKTATLTFDDYAADSKGYTYTVYAKNAAGDKTVYAAGALAGRSVSFDVLAAAGVRLYAEVAAIAADGSMSAYTESEIGTVAEGEKTFTISHEAYDGENPFVVNVTNNGTKRTIKLLAAEYDEDGILVAGHIKSFALEPNSENKLELEFTPDPDKGTASIKCFAWDTNNKPFFGAVEY